MRILTTGTEILGTSQAWTIILLIVGINLVIGPFMVVITRQERMNDMASALCVVLAVCGLLMTCLSGNMMGDKRPRGEYQVAKVTIDETVPVIAIADIAEITDIDGAIYTLTAREPIGTEMGEIMEAELWRYVDDTHGTVE